MKNSSAKSTRQEFHILALLYRRMNPAFEFQEINTYDEEVSLLEALRETLGWYAIECRISGRIYSYTSYILKNVSTLKFEGQAVPGISDERVVEDTVEEFDFLGTDFADIGIILEEIERQSSTDLDAHTFALSLFEKLRGDRYTMNFILVGTLAAFAVTHGVWLLVLKFICAHSTYRKESISMILKRVEGLFITLRRNQGKGDTSCYPEFYIYISLLSSSITRMAGDNWESMASLDSLIKTMLEVVPVAHLFLKDVFVSLTESLRSESDSLMLLSIYWVTRGVLACSSACLQLPKNGYIIQNPQELEDIRKKLVSVLERLQKLDGIGKQYMEDEKIANAYQIPNKEGQDNYFALMALFGLPPNGSQGFKLVHCCKDNMEASVVSLRHKVLVLIISGLNISSNVIDILSEIYVESMAQLKQAECEFIWLPMCSVPWTTSMEEKYVKLKQRMPWYTVHHPTFLTASTKEFIRDIWKFHKKLIAVVLDEDGNVVCPNAIHLMYVSRAKAFPYTRMKMRALWKDETRLESLVLGYDPNILEASETVILYGGIDIDWIRKFVARVQELPNQLGTPVKPIFMGKIGDSEKIQEIISSIALDMPDSYSLDLKNIWYFWTRLESLLISRHQATSASVHSKEPIIREVQELLCYGSAESWACLITPASGKPMIHGDGDLMLKAVTEYILQTPDAQSKNFTKTLYKHVEEQQRRRIQDYPCSRIVLNIDDKDVVESLACSHCIHSMDKKIQYRCCHVDDELDPSSS